MGLPGRDQGVVNIEVEGGRYGLLLDGDSANTTIVGAKLYRQTDSAIVSKEFAPITVVGFEIIKDSGPVITTQAVSWATSVGTMSLIDGKITIGDGSLAIDNSSEINLYLRNVYVTGTNNLVQSGSQPTVTAAGTWKRIEEYAYNDFDDEAEGVDLLSVLTHEMGHLLGMGHDSANEGVMGETLGAGERRGPSRDSAYDAALSSW